ncbi:hypothetical protein PsalN5692_02706 [Piscirickettsia salmonis]|uniref:hypothetical protein n=2 Tax=Piscirickettsia salmonis TaxID=1238 RepID=UPI0012B744CB|nr:hypothetical protein [Piscirickettsia salmonis]QGP51225.1 hypothetical protein PsalN5692_02706 [Piscirickettsia salmonis]QGP53578.1 hypothetical protein PsalSR1_00992 [Piscirickettsia salmonis]QGP60506.1 hypothetical protein PsalBI1_03121 [Piscirickettsia salmonis]QGP63149.1 hypothetical protein PsalMR5_00996 [Piscirickettsia salmonis]
MPGFLDNMSGVMALGAPDTDIVGPAAVASVNTANFAETLNPVINIFLGGSPAINALATTATTLGSVGPGILSGTACGPASRLPNPANATLIIGGAPAATSPGDQTMQNLINVPIGATVTPGQLTIIKG